MNPTQNLSVSAADTDTPAEVVTPATILRGAATYLETHGWTQGDYYATTSPFPPACAAGAIVMAAHGTRIEDPLACYTATTREFRLAIEALNSYLIDQGAVIPDPDEWSAEPTSSLDWNDRDERTADAVIAALRAAADEYDWQHATEDDLETYADKCVWNETHPDREGFLAWLAWRAAR
jgi:hypothetical protein